VWINQKQFQDNVIKRILFKYLKVFLWVNKNLKLKVDLSVVILSILCFSRLNKVTIFRVVALSKLHPIVIKYSLIVKK
jgi:hypothetical protein